jgi:expansin (peptidoglycan-binding protein)
MTVGRRRRRRVPRRRLLAFVLGGGAALGAAAVAVAVGISQAASSPACASAVMAGNLARNATQGALQGQTSGEATHYVLQAGDGNCSYPGLAAGQLYVALSPAEYGSAAACGSYLQVTGPDGSVTAEVVDQCPDCQTGHIDLSEQAFAKIAPLSAGLVPVTYHAIADPSLPGPLSLEVKEGSSQYWLALLPINSGNPVTSVRVRGPAGGWQDLAHASYNYWLAASGAGPGPFTVELTDSAGHQVIVTGISISPGVVQATSTWMYGTGGPPPAPAPAPTPAATRVMHSPAPVRSAVRPARSRKVPVPVADVAGQRDRKGPQVPAAAPTPSC